MFILIFMVIISILVLICLKILTSPEGKTFSQIGLGVVGILWFIIAITCMARIDPGEVGVVVDMFGSTKGVEEKELTVGYHFVPPWQTLYTFPIFEQNHQWTGGEAFSFQTSEGLAALGKNNFSKKY